MAAERRIALAVLAILASFTALSATELPSRNKKPKPPEAPRHCDVVGLPGVMAPNGVCVRLSGYVSAGFAAGRLK